jgi:hypothetical protein
MAQSSSPSLPVRYGLISAAMVVFDGGFGSAYR